MNDANATLLGANLAFLREHAPFDGMETPSLDFLARRLELAYFPEGSVLLEPGMGVPPHFYIVQRGAIRVEGADGGEPASLLAGECFPIGAASGERPSVNRYTAAQDSFCYRLARADFLALLGQSPVFNRFCNAYLASLLGQTHLRMQQALQQKTLEQQNLAAPLLTLIRRAPLACPASMALADAFAAMAAQQAGSIVVVDADRPVGILTQSDLLPRVVLPATPLSTPIGEVMTAAPHTLPESATVYDATLAMATHGIRHVLLTDPAGRLSGVISERDLFAMQRVSLRQLRQQVERAADIAALAAAADDLRKLALNMLAQGWGSEQLTRFVSAMNDGIVRRAIALTLDRHELSGIRWCWLAFGSEGREEQTFSTDQDNGIVFECDGDPNDAHARLVAFAGDTVAALDRCGFPLCQGNIMASNPELTLTLDAWRQRFSRWIAAPEPKALLAATIFFDLRALAGDETLAQSLSSHLFASAQGNTMFQHMLAANALSTQPPLGLLREFVTETVNGEGGYLDLKKSGARLFVDAARVLALAQGVASSHTLTRLEQAGRKSGIAQEELEAMLDAFRFIQLLRMQGGQSTGHGQANLVRVDALNPLERRMLKVSLQQARKLQAHLKLRYAL